MVPRLKAPLLSAGWGRAPDISERLLRSLWRGRSEACAFLSLRRRPRHDPPALGPREPPPLPIVPELWCRSDASKRGSELWRGVPAARSYQPDRLIHSCIECIVNRICRGRSVSGILRPCGAHCIPFRSANLAHCSMNGPDDRARQPTELAIMQLIIPVPARRTARLR